MECFMMTGRRNGSDTGQTLKSSLVLTLLLLQQVCTGATLYMHDDEFCGKKPCLFKCCDLHMWIDEALKCEEPDGSRSNNFTIPTFINDLGTQGTYEEDKWHVLYGLIKCVNDKAKYLKNPLAYSTDVFRVTKYGWLVNKKNKTIASLGKFCLEESIKYNTRYSFS